MYGDLFAKAIVRLVLAAVLIAMPLGWAAIEGLIWIYAHVSVSVN